MGTDIYLVVEVRERGVWRVADPEEIGVDYNDWVYPGRIPGIDQVDGDRSEWLKKRKWTKGATSHECDRELLYGYEDSQPRWWNDRSYTAFTVLAGVRERYDIPPIDEPRGWPKDSPAAGGMIAPFCGDESDLDDDLSGSEHSASWVSLRELEEYDWDYIITHEYVEDPYGDAPLMRMKTHRVGCCCRGFVRFVEKLGRFYRRANTKTGDPGIGPDDVRLVFGFDN